MKPVEHRLPQDVDKSFIVFRELGQSFPEHWHFHPEYEMVLVERSTGRRMVGDHIGYFEEGDLVFVGSLLPHVWINDSAKVKNQPDHIAEAIVIQFTENFVGEFFWTIPEMQSVKAFLELSSRGFVIKGGKREQISVLMKKMLNMNGIERLSALFAIFAILSSSLNDQEFLASPGFMENLRVSASDRFSKVTEHIMRNFDRDITLEEISSVANMAQTTFCKFFKTNYHVTFVEYLNVVRVGHACKLLAEGNQSIIQIAYASGFNNLANFNRQFRKIKNMPPKEYRKSFYAER
jgi:AraC-like DNA-binding protein